MMLTIYHSHLGFSIRSPDYVSASPLKPLSCLNPRFSHNAPKTPELVSKSAIQRITEKLQSLGYVAPDSGADHGRSVEPGPDSPGEIFISRQLPARRVGHTIDDSWSSPDHPLPSPGAGPAFGNFFKIKRGLDEEMRREKELAGKEKRAPAPSLAEVMIPKAELRRLRSEGIRLEKRLKVGKAGITEGIVNGIHERWRRTELVKIKCEDLCRMNMKRTHETLERKTGGLVIWRSGSIIVLYRGANYEYPYFVSRNGIEDETAKDALSSDSRSDIAVSRNEGNPSFDAKPNSSSTLSRPSLVPGVGSPNRLRFSLPGEVQLEEEADRLLDGLGPRFADWWGYSYNPLPVDADFLPAVVPGYRRPFRLLPYGVKPKLTDREMTVLRRLGRPLPCHFALGRNRNLQGLADAMIKLWEKCEIAKIAVKRGVQNTNSELMAEELKRLTGGTLISRDREFIVFYRGKDFLPPAVSAAMEERRKSILSSVTERQGANKNSFGVLPEQRPFEASPVSEIHTANEEKEPVIEQKKLRSTASIVESVEAKLSRAIAKKTKTEKLLEKLEKAANLRTPEEDKEGISEEERYMLRKVGLRMKAFLLMGRRGVFDGTIENMHLHWKYRELVKVICKDTSIEEVQGAALTLEAESGGILVAVERVNKGHAIIVYRGKNYQRPPNLRPKTLLNKREALKRSLEAQRHQSLKLHVLKLASDIDNMQLELEKEGMTTAADNELKIDEPSSAGSDNQVDIEIPKVDDLEASSLINFNDVSGNTGTPAFTNESASDDRQTGSLPKYNDQFGLLEDYSSSGSDESDCQSYPDSSSYFSNVVKRESAHEDEAGIATTKEMREPFEPFESRSYSAIRSEMEESDIVGTLRSAPLSNRERLLLRRQALKMKKRPVLAIGRNNVITGVAKAIKTHFQKNPLAIVNIKGRAKGTSIQELIFRLEQATGSELISQEPNKVILYRGRGEVEERTRGYMKEKNGQSPESTSVKGWEEAQEISPELMAAIRIECGFETGPESGEVGELVDSK